MPDIPNKFSDLKLIDTISFNNFKPFGEKMQKFSKKPITLIYGPNSIGKSSLIHLLAYHHKALFKGDFDMTELSDFGDSISLGGFKEFVHKKNDNTTIKLKYVLNKFSIQNYDKYYKEAKLIMDVSVPPKEKQAKDIKIQYLFDNEVFMDIKYTNGGYYEAIPNTNHTVIKTWIDKIYNDYNNWSKKDFDKALDLKNPIKYPIRELLNESFIKNVPFSDKYTD